MPRRTSIPRKSKYEVVPANRITHRFSAKLMKGGKQNLAERILRQALARAEAQAGRPGLEIM
jgi:ribosomal protein S7